MSTIGAKIRDARKVKGMSEKDLALAVGVSVAYITKIEQGKLILTVDVAGRIAKILVIPIEAFFEDTPTVDELDQELTKLAEGLRLGPKTTAKFMSFPYKEKIVAVRLFRVLVARIEAN